MPVSMPPGLGDRSGLGSGGFQKLQADVPSSVLPPDARLVADAPGQGAAQLDAAQTGEFHPPLPVVPDLLHAAGRQEGAGAGQCRALGSWGTGPEFGVAPVVHGLSEVPEGAGGNDGGDLGDEGVVLPLAGVEGLADVLPAGPEEPVAAAETVGPDGQVVAEPVDVDALAAVLFLPDGQVDGDLCPGVDPAVGTGILVPVFGSSGHGACTST